jgi:hypothetical protein
MKKRLIKPNVGYIIAITLHATAHIPQSLQGGHGVLFVVSNRIQREGKVCVEV